MKVPKGRLGKLLPAFTALVAGISSPVAVIAGRRRVTYKAERRKARNELAQTGRSG
jgi:hypothetical protein